MHLQLSNVNVKEMKPLPTPRSLKKQFPLPDSLAAEVFEHREIVKRILSGADPRLMVVVGPCSIRNAAEALEYGRKLRVLAQEVASKIFIMMRAYYIKPRTTIGWKGLANDPDLNGTHDIAKGYEMARSISLELVRFGLPLATEFLDPYLPQYIDDCISWAAIGARNTESQTNREMASGLSMAVGFKNGTDCNVDIAIDAIESVKHPQVFPGMNSEGQLSQINSTGHEWAHLILRGGRDRTNYDAESVAEASAKLSAKGLRPTLMIDCSHGNSRKDHRNQSVVLADAIRQRRSGTQNIVALMLESDLVEGAEKIPSNLLDFNSARLPYGKSITDACISFEETERLLRTAYTQL